MENENATTEPSGGPESKTEKGASDHINPISLRYLRDAWKELREESGSANPPNEQIVERAVHNKLKGTKFTSKELDDTETHMAVTLGRAIAKRERNKELETQKGDSVTTIMPEEPPTEFWEDFPELIPKDENTKSKKVEPLDWHTKWEWDKEEREERISEAFSAKKDG